MKQARTGRMAPSAGIATGLVAPLALGAPGNLDPGFADHGRIVLDGESRSQAWSVEALDDGGVFVAGGEPYFGCNSGFYYYCDFADGFASELTAQGELEESFTGAKLNDVEVRDAIRQPDGRIVMAGRRVDRAEPAVQTLTVYRLEASGALDTSFASQGIFELPSDLHGTVHLANSLVLDSDGRIVVSGASGVQLIVLRLLADGTLDASFGVGGVFTGPLHDFESRTFIERTAAGYRVSTTGASQCRIVALTDSGEMDDSFGAGGVAPIQTIQGEATACSAMASQPDGTLLLSGTANDQPFVTRMLTTGAPDPAFAAAAVTDVMTEATAVAVDDSGRILVGGSGEPGLMIRRLDAGGGLDASFGEAGTALVDLPSDNGVQSRINALDVGLDGRLVAAGQVAVDYYPYFASPFVVQLLGDGGGDSPGVISVVQPAVESAEGEDLIIKVRRTGGKSGSVGVAYATAPGPDNYQFRATAGTDYDTVAGTLTWADGDASEREIAVPIRADDGGPEDKEGFRVVLSDPQGGAGLGTKNALAYVLPDGTRAGQFALEVYNPDLSEPGLAQVYVYRNYFSDGAVSVTVTPVAGTASADDFDATPITLNWADQEGGVQEVQIEIANDGDRESAETFTVELTSPTGGAIVGPRASAQFTIGASDPVRAITNGNGGGGSTGWLSVLLLGLAELLRRSPALRAAPPRPRARR
jgi:uncharacterized delta-60 repeat protein